MHNHPKLVVMAGVLSVSSSPILIRLSSAPAITIAFYRMFFATVLLTPLLLASVIRMRSRLTGTGPNETGTNETDPNSTDPNSTGPNETGLTGIDRRSIALTAVSGLLLALHFAFWISSLQRTTVANASVLVNTHPLFVMALSAILLRERLTRQTILWVTIAFGGAIILVLPELQAGGSTALGNLLALLGAVTVSIYLLIGRLLRPRLPTLVYSYSVYLVSAIALFLCALVGDIPLDPTHYPPMEHTLFLLLALLPTLLGHSLFHWALRHLSATFVSTAILGEPIIATLLALIIFSETPHILNLIGGLITLTALFFMLRVRTGQPA